MNKLIPFLWKLFYFLIFIILIKVLGNLFGIQLEHKYVWFNFIFMGIPVLLLIIHSFITLSVFRSLIFIFLASGIGALMEYIGMRNGTFFGGHYIYKPQLTIFTVPISVIFYWAVFIYTGYCLTNSFIYWLNKSKPNLKNKNIFLLFLTILLDGYFVTAIDLFMDPIAVKSGSWKWLDGGPYFGIPIGNFIGWFIVTIMVVGIFRTYEYFFPKKESGYNKSTFIIPVLGYGIMSISYFFLALNFNQTLAIVGLLFMFPQIIANLILFKKYKLNNKHLSDYKY